MFSQRYIPDPDTNVIANGLKFFEESNADVIVAIGGGSAIDTAKGILYFTWKFKNSNDNNINKPLFIAIPSTSGTGSEVTDFTVITSGNEKVCIIDEFISPDIAILDSTCIQHVPQRVDNIHSLGVNKNKFEEAIENMPDTALLDRCTLTNPKQPTKEDLINIYRKCY